MIKKYLFLTMMLSLTLSVSGQDITITYQAKDRSLTQIFRDLEKQFKLHFAYSTRQLKGKKASVNANGQSLDQFLAAILRPHQLTHELIDEEFVSVTTPESVFVRAKVVDGETGESLPFATLRLKDTYQGSISDADGNFNVVIDEPLGAVVEFSFLGYQTAELPIEGYESPERIEIQMEPEVQNLQQVVIKEYINNGITVDDRASKIRINPQEMEILPGLAERDILLSAQILAGVNSNDESASGMNVRGSSRDNTFIYWNNIPVYQAAHYFGNISSFIPSSIGSVDIYKNHVPVNYGGASAALLLMESQKSQISKPEFESSINLTHADFYTRMPFLQDQGSFMFAARRSYNDLFSTPTFTALSNKLFEGSITQDVQQSVDENFKFNSKLVFSDLNLQWIYEPSGRDRFKFSALRSGSVLDFNSVNEDEFIESVQLHEVVNYGLNAQWDHRWGEKLQSNLSASFSSYDMDYRLTEFRELGDDSDDDQETRSNFLRNLEIRLDNDYAIARNHVLNFGYQLNLLDASYEINESSFFEEDFEGILDTQGAVHGLFGDYTGKLTNDFQLGFGLRMNNYTNTGQLVVDPQLRLSYDLNKHWLLKSSVGIYRQYLSAMQEAEFTFSNSIEQNWVVADEENNVPLIVNRQAVLGFLYEKEGWLVDLDVYAKDVDGLIARNFGAAFSGGGLNIFVGNERILGLDITMKKRWKNYRAWLSYSFQDSKAEIPEYDLNNFTSGLNIRHQFQFSQTLNIGQFEFSLGYSMKSGLPFTKITGITEVTVPGPDDDPNEFEPYFEFNFDRPNTDRLPSYHRVDISAWYKFPKTKLTKIRGEVGISILNLLNRKNVFSRTVEIDDFGVSGIGTFELDKHLLGITPNLSLRLKF